MTSHPVRSRPRCSGSSSTFDEYSSPIDRLRQRLIVVPPAVHGGQHRREWSLTVEGVDDTVRRTRHDRWGNVIIDVGAPRVERSI